MVAGEEREAARRRWLRKGLQRPLLPPVLPKTDCKRREGTGRDGQGEERVSRGFGVTTSIFPGDMPNAPLLLCTQLYRRDLV